MKCWPLDLRHLQRDSGFSAGFGAEGEPAYTLTSALTGGGNIPAVALAEREKEMDSSREVYPIQTQNALHNSDVPAGGIGIGKKDGPTQTMRADGKPPAVGIINEPKYVVRRITPKEAERLMGMRDGWTDIEWKGKPVPDTARYRCLGNSMVTVVMRFIALRIADALADN